MTTFNDLLVDTRSRELLTELVDGGVTGHLVVLEAPGDVATHAATAVGHAMLGADTAAIDLRVASAATGRWTVAELDEQVIAAASLAPTQRAIVVVEAAERMDPTSADHLLKTLEEPANGALFLFCVENADRLGTTIRSRAAATLRLSPLSAAELIAHLTDQGVPDDRATSVVELCGAYTALAEAAATDDDLYSAVQAALGASLWDSATRPSTNAAALAAALETLAKAQMGRGAKAVAVRARARELSRVLVSRWRNEAGQRLRDGTAAPRDVRTVAAVLDSLEEALALNASLAVAFNGALVRVHSSVL